MNKVKMFLGASFFLLLIVACASQEKVAKKDTIPSDQFAFIELYNSTEGKVLKGEAPSARRIDSPTYSFNPESKEFQIYRLNNVAADSVKVLLGVGRILKGAAGSGVSSVLIGMNEIPHKYADIEIQEVSASSVKFKYMDETISIKSGEKWDNVKTSTDTISYKGESVIQKITTVSVQFHGLFPKTLIKKN